MLLPVDHAIKLLLEQATPTDKIIRIPVANASGKILAEDILSTINVPPADNSAMDGYTLRLADAKTSQPIPISQRIPAGATPAALKPGTAARIFTGAQIPEGAEVVIMQENAEVIDDRVIFTTTPESAGANIRCAGEDIKAGEKILHRGTRLRPQELGLLASIGMDQVSVFKPVRVAVLSTGSELVEPGNPLQAGQIYNSNRPMILSLLQSLGFEAIDAGICTDNLAGTKAALEEAANNADIVMTSGGVSVGEEDHVKAAVEALGELNLWKVAIKPGKPFAFGHIDMEFLPRAKVLTLEEMQQIATAFVELGVKKIRLTGGEPLVRKGIVELARHIGKLNGLSELAMTTNGVLLDDFAQPLADAGVSRINISIDSLKAERFRAMTRFGALNQVLHGIESAQSAGFKRIKLNAVILAGVNDDELIDLARYALDGGMDISFIEEMPLGHIDAHQRKDTVTASQQLRERLNTELGLEATDKTTGGPSRYWKADGYHNLIGFISPMSENFCESCNRVRLTAEGQLLLCLGNEHSLDLRGLIRRYPGDMDKLKSGILEAILRKPERHYFDPNDTTIVRFMSATGG
eukprot:g4489.t1